MQDAFILFLSSFTRRDGSYHDGFQLERPLVFRHVCGAMASGSVVQMTSFSAWQSTIRGLWPANGRPGVRTGQIPTAASTVL